MICLLFLAKFIKSNVKVSKKLLPSCTFLYMLVLTCCLPHLASESLQTVGQPFSVFSHLAAKNNQRNRAYQHNTTSLLTNIIGCLKRSTILCIPLPHHQLFTSSVQIPNQKKIPLLPTLKCSLCQALRNTFSQEHSTYRF